MKYSFEKIGVTDPRGASVFLTEAILNPIANKVGMMEIMFEDFQVNRIQYGYQALMSLYAEGMMTALLLDSGDGVSHFIAVYDGDIIKSRFERLDVGGRDVTNHLLKLLHMRGYDFNSS